MAWVNLEPGDGRICELKRRESFRDGFLYRVKILRAEIAVEMAQSQSVPLMFAFAFCVCRGHSQFGHLVPVRNPTS